MNGFKDMLTNSSGRIGFRDTGYNWKTGEGGKNFNSDESSPGEGYQDVATGKWVKFGRGEQPADYDLQRPGVDNVRAGTSDKRIANTNNSMLRHDVQEGGYRAESRWGNVMGGRVAKLYRTPN